MEPKLVEDLTNKQHAEFPRFRQKWIEIAECTERINKEEARQAIMQCYDSSSGNLQRPDFVIFLESPFQLFYARPIWNRMAKYLEKAKDNERFYNESNQPEGALWYTTIDSFMGNDEIENWRWELRVHAVATIWDAIIDEVKDVVPDLDFRGDERAFFSALAELQKEWLSDFDQLLPILKTEASQELGAEVYGQDETWLVYYDFMEWAGSTGLEGTHGLQRLAKNAGWWIPYNTFAAVSDRPVKINVDSQGQLHSHSEPAIEFTDGWKYYASHGMKIPNWIVEYPEKLTVEAINNEENVEIRRVMLEIYGFERYFKSSNAELVDKGDIERDGVLWRIPFEDDEDIYMLEMQNSTPNQDETFKTYFIRVPPYMESAKQAMAWSYGFENPDDYNPILTS